MQKLFSPWRSQYIASFVEAESSAAADEAANCVFCTAFTSGDDAGSLVLFRGREAFVIMNKFPYNSGHLMVLPVRHTGDFQSLTLSEHAELMTLLAHSERALRELSHPQGFNLGMNLGRTAGAGIDGHLHWHLVPRWNGDTNFMPVLNDVKIVSEDMTDQWKRLREIFQRIEIGWTAQGPGRHS
ncbi:MAG: HIT family protein [Acidobacteriaceae bacterium]